MYESKSGSLYVKSNECYYPCRVSVGLNGREVTVTGDAVATLPEGIFVTLDEVIARYGLTEGGTYPKVQPEAATAAPVAQPEAQPAPSAVKAVQPKK